MRQAAKYNIQATEALPQLLALRFVDAEGEALDMSGMSLRGAVLQDGGIVELGCEMTGANTALVSWPRLVAGCGRYDLFLTDEAGKEYPLLRGGVHVVERVTPADGSEVEGSGVVAGGLVVTIPEAVDGAVTICEDCSVEVGALIAEAVSAVEGARDEAVSAVESQGESSVAAVRAAGAEGVQMAGLAEQYAVQAYNSAQSAAALDSHALESAQRAETAAGEAAGVVSEHAESIMSTTVAGHAKLGTSKVLGSDGGMVGKSTTDQLIVVPAATGYAGAVKLAMDVASGGNSVPMSGQVKGAIDEGVEASLWEFSLGAQSLGGDGAYNTEFNWCEWDGARVQGGEVASVCIPCRSNASGSMAAMPVFLSLWQKDAAGAWVHQGFSINAVTQVAGVDSVWRFSGVVLADGRAVRVCPVPDFSRGWVTSLVLGGRRSASTDGSKMEFSGVHYTYTIEATVSVKMGKVARFAERGDLEGHVGDEGVHVSAAERAAWNGKVSATELEGIFAAWNTWSGRQDFSGYVGFVDGSQGVLLEGRNGGNTLSLMYSGAESPYPLDFSWDGNRWRISGYGSQIFLPNNVLKVGNTIVGEKLVSHGGVLLRSPSEAGDGVQLLELDSNRLALVGTNVADDDGNVTAFKGGTRLYLPSADGKPTASELSDDDRVLTRGEVVALVQELLANQGN